MLGVGGSGRPAHAELETARSGIRIRRDRDSLRAHHGGLAGAGRAKPPRQGIAAKQSVERFDSHRQDGSAAASWLGEA